ncbi:GntR family transcriptional regulator [Kiloniella sp.]|uniref:GntR family transcriptional regulator n=1 Tax=Kiloniella sp. TaxID=1938587 RepID=UPI003B01B6FA
MNKEFRVSGLTNRAPLPSNWGMENTGNSDIPTSVVATLRNHILLGEKAAGEKLNQEDIAQELNVSRIPVREAFKTLQGEGLVRIEPYRGAWVRSYSEKDVRDVYDMRMVLEPMALTLAFDNLTKTDLGAAEDILMSMDYRNDILESSEKNWDFHATLYRPCDREHLMETLGKLLTASQHMTIIGWAHDRRFDKSQREHYYILEACQKGDLKQAVKQVKHHTEAAMLSTLTALRKSKKI